MIVMVIKLRYTFGIVFFFFLSIGNKSFVVKWVHFMNFLLYWKIVKGNNRSAEFSFPKLNETECNKY